MTDLRTLLLSTFPIASRYFSLEWVEDPDPRPDEKDELRVVLRLFCSDMGDGGEPRIRDIKEQVVLLVPRFSRNEARLEGWLGGLKDALSTVMRSHDAAVERYVNEPWPVGDSLEAILPMDLVPTQVLKLVRPRTAEDFSRALLGSRKRLGRLLIPPPS